MRNEIDFDKARHRIRPGGEGLDRHLVLEQGFRKTQVAIACSERSLHRFHGGAFFADLAPLPDAACLPERSGSPGLPARPIRALG